MQDLFPSYQRMATLFSGVLICSCNFWDTGGSPSSGLPHPAALIDESWDTEEREIVVDYLVRGFVARVYMGTSACRICGRRNGSLEFTDGVFIWPEGLAHYVKEHAVRLPEHFVRHVRSFTDDVESAEVDESWWRSQA
jgi:hypothetical protein